MFTCALVSFFSIQIVKSMSLQKPSYLFDKSGPENEITDFIYSKGYLPNENNLPESTVMKSSDGDVTYLLSKLSDSELIKLLNDQPKKKSYDLDDIIKMRLGVKNDNDRKFSVLGRDTQNEVNAANNRFHKTPRVENSQQAYYKLNHKPVLQNEQNNEVNFLALKKLQNLLTFRPEQDDEELTEERKELLFDILVSQLKTLCCKSDKSSLLNNLQIANNNNMLSNFPKGRSYLTEMKTSQFQNANEFMFLIVNDEIRSKNTDDLIFVDPESLEKNSSVLLLGPITAPLTNSELKIVMNRISKELSKPEYASLLQQLSDGTLSNSNISLMKNFIFGPETRRYIKPHRCNYQSKLAKIYGGPRWLICTGYLNLNTPSLYD